MRKINKTALVFFALSCSISTGYGQNNSLEFILSKELTRSFEALSAADPPVYYMDYRVDDKKSLSLEANFGNIIDLSNTHVRLCQPTVRVGSFSMDNTREIDAYGGGYGSANTTQYVPLNNSEIAIRQTLWRLTDQAYKSARKKYQSVKYAADDDPTTIDDFSKEQPEVFYEPELTPVIDTAYWKKVIKDASSVFRNQKNLISGKVYLNFDLTRKTLITTEGSIVTQNAPLAQLFIVGEVFNEDNEVVSLYESFNAPLPSGLPPADTIIAKAGTLLNLLHQLNDAPFAEPYTGPAILHPRVSAVFFHEIFGHRIEGHRLKSDSDGQTFKEKVGTQILPTFIDIYADPTRQSFNESPLNGSYRYDDQGIAARRVNIVESGILNTFLMSRSPIEDFDRSNGHGRSEIGADPVARQSNIIVEVQKKYAAKSLRQLLIEECIQQGKKYGYYFKDVTGGFTQTSRYATNAFNIMPTLVYKVYTDGRADELVKGVDLIGTPLAMFAEVVAAGDRQGVFNGICGAESGNVPVSAVAPGLLVRRIETQKKPVNERKSEQPLLPSPEALKN